MNFFHPTRFDSVKMVSRQIGGLHIVLGYSLILPGLVSLLYAEFFSAAGFFISAIFALLMGHLSYSKITTQHEPLSYHAMMVASLGWLSIVLMGAIPFYLIAWITPADIAQQFVPQGSNYPSSLYFFRNPLHAIFESMSGFTTTGLSMATREPSIGKGLLFYRHYTQLLGGAGFIVLTLSLLKQSSGKTSFLMYTAESTGEWLQSTVIETARSIWKVYLGLTFFCIVFLIVGTYLLLPDYPLGNNIFDAINHGMAGMSTGGFSTLDDSIAGYNSFGMELLHLLPMILGSMALPFYVKVIINKKYDLIWKDLQTISLIILFIVGSIVLSVMLNFSGKISEPFRVGLFQFVSALSTTGWQTSDAHQWDSASVFFIVMSGMVVGGAFGATVGGLKIIRVLALMKGVIWRINSFFVSDNSVNVVRFNQQRLLPEEARKEVSSAAIFTFVYMVFLMLGTIVSYYTMDAGFGLKDALFESASAQGTVGLSCGITHPEMSTTLEITYILQMWAGRLEIIPFLVLVRAVVFGTKPRIV